MLSTTRRKQWASITRKNRRRLPNFIVVGARKRLAFLQRRGKEQGFISTFARRHGLSVPAVYSMLRGFTYKELPFAVPSPNAPAVRKRKTLSRPAKRTARR